MTSGNTRPRRAWAAGVLALALPLAGVAAPAAAASGPTVSGVITDKTGQPIEGATAHLCAFAGDAPSETAGEAATDADGRYQFTDVPHGAYAVLFTDPESTQQDGSRFFLSSWLGGTAAKGDSCSPNADSEAERINGGRC